MPATWDIRFPAEFVYPKYFHKKGALSAARTSDEVNPERESSASQFYIVTGKIYSDSELAQMEKQKEGRLKQSIFARLQKENAAKIKAAYQSDDKAELAIIRDTLVGKTELEAEKRKEEAKLTPEQREAYKTIGGVPFLDNEYTVYGEVVEGLDVVDAIQNVKTNRQDRPIGKCGYRISGNNLIRSFSGKYTTSFRRTSNVFIFRGRSKSDLEVRVIQFRPTSKLN